MKKLVIAFIFQFSLILTAIAQYNYAEEILNKQTEQVNKTNAVKLDLGLGLGAAGSGVGVSGRLAAGFNIRNWGGTFRMIAATGKTGNYVHGWLGGYSLKEEFHERAVLINRAFKHYNKSQLIAGIGLGSVRGNRLNDEGSLRLEFDKLYGFAYEVSWETTGKIVGGSAQLYGNINNEGIFIGISFCLTLGVWWN